MFNYGFELAVKFNTVRANNCDWLVKRVCWILLLK
jgi:hypothetical protein